jgi:hypothetical protein
MSAVAMGSWALAALALGLVGSALGVARMRAWGLLLGLATSLASLAAAYVTRAELLDVLFVTAAVPGALLGATLLAARVRAMLGRLPAAPVRVEASGRDFAPVRARIAVDEEDADALVAPVRAAAEGRGSIA